MHSLRDGLGQSRDRLRLSEAGFFGRIDDDPRLHQNGRHGRGPQHRQAVVAVDAQAAVDERAVFAFDRLGVVCGRLFAGGLHALADVPGACQAARRVRVQHRHEDRIACEFGLAARREESRLRRVVMDRHEKVGVRCALRAPCRGGVRADALDPGRPVAQRGERADEGGGQVAVVQILGAAAGACRAWPFRSMARIHQDVRGVRRPGAAQGQQEGEQGVYRRQEWVLRRRDGAGRVGGAAAS